MYLTILFAVSGLVIGSFINCFAYRYARGESVIKGRSHCVCCGHMLAPRDLVPVLSWLLLRGKCRYCKERISPRYLFAELVCAALFVTVFLRFGLNAEALRGLIFLSLMQTAAATDSYCGLIPDRITVAGVLTALIFALLPPDGGIKQLLNTLLGGIAVGVPLLVIVLLFDKLKGRETMGGGDIKLMFTAGLFVGWKLAIMLVILACVFGIAFALLQKKRKEEFPFAPAIFAASWLTLLGGDLFVGWYSCLFKL